MAIAGTEARLCDSSAKSMQRVVAPSATARSRQSSARSEARPSAGNIAIAKKAAFALR